MPDGTKGLAYQCIIPLLIEAIKTQQRDIEEMREMFHESLSRNYDNQIKNNEMSLNTIQPVTEKSFLYQNNPNPFSVSTIIKYQLDKFATDGKILILNMQGELLKTYQLTNQPPYEITIYGEELKAGMYLYSLIVDGKEADTKRMILTN